MRKPAPCQPAASAITRRARCLSTRKYFMWILLTGVLSLLHSADNYADNHTNSYTNSYTNSADIITEVNVDPAYFAGTQTTHRETPIIVSATGKYSLEGKMEYYVPQNTTNDINTILKEHTTDFIAFSQNSLAFPNKDVWLRFTLANTSTTSSQYILDLNDIMFNAAEFFYVSEEQKVLRQITGLKYEYNQRSVKYRNFGFAFTVPAKGVYTYYVRINTPHYLAFMPCIVDPITLNGYLEHTTFYAAGLIGMLFGILMYNLLILVRTQDYDKTMLLYCVFLLFAIVTLCFLSGFSLGAIDTPPWLARNEYTLVVSGVVVSYLAVTRQQFKDHRLNTAVNLFFRLMSLVMVCIISYSLLVSAEIATLVMVFFSSFALLSMFCLSVYLLIFESTQLRWFALGNIVFVSITAISNIGSYGILTSPWMARHSFELGLCFLCFFLSMSVSDKINAYRRKQEDLQKHTEMSRENSEAKSEFLAKMSHEIRTPMNGIVGMLDLMRDTPLSSQQALYLNIINNSSNDLLHIINDILDYSKIEAGKLTLENIDFNLKSLVDEINALVGTQCNVKNIRYSAAIDPQIPNHLMGDPVRLRQILMNLLSNALKFTSKGEIRLVATFLRMQGRRCRLQLSVIDTGIGIDEVTQGKLFSSFTQADNSTTRKFGGTGLGLAICRQLANLMGGDIIVKSVPGRGATFTVVLELGVSPQAQLALEHPDSDLDDTTTDSPYDAPDQASELAAVTTTPGFSAPPLAKPKRRSAQVLVVEDNRVNQQVVEGMLARLNLTVDVVNNGLEAVERLVRDGTRYDIVLMDCEMPVLDGFSATRKIREHEDLTESPRQVIIALTAHAIPGYRQRCLDAGMDEHISKPINSQEMKQLLERYATLPDKPEKPSAPA